MVKRKKKHTKYLFVTGGVVSSIGKGISASSIAALMRARGLKITMLKLDPYINVDPGTMNPFQHGEVYVTDDGAETDLDLGHYERFTGTTMGKKNNFTTGQVYETIISKERQGTFLGGTVQVIPHITNEIKQRMIAAGKGFDLCIIEVGGTVGDIESLPFLEALRQMRQELEPDDTVAVHVTYLPYLKAAGEMKSKPTQHSVMALRQIGIQPDMIICRGEYPVTDDVRNKISLFCNVPLEQVFSAPDKSFVYEVPLDFHTQELDNRLVELLNIWSREPELDEWQRLVDALKNPKGTVRIAIVGKYTGLAESYKSLHEALIHGGVVNNVKVDLQYVESSALEEDGLAALKAFDAILVPGGFGKRGIEGKIQTIQYARENKIPFLGLCLGLQLSVVEFARNVAGMKGAHSTEFNGDTKFPVIDLIPEQRNIKNKGATMRLGAYNCQIEPDTLAYRVYGKKDISERHRHRYEVNNELLPMLRGKGLVISGMNPKAELVEMVEYADHPFFLATQFHPELKSRPLEPHPIFVEFVRAAVQNSKDRGQEG